MIVFVIFNIEYEYYGPKSWTWLGDYYCAYLDTFNGTIDIVQIHIPAFYENYKQNIPSHSRSPVYPSLHLHSKDPIAFTHSAFLSHGTSSSAHSSISTTIQYTLYSQCRTIYRQGRGDWGGVGRRVPPQFTMIKS